MKSSEFIINTDVLPSSTPHPTPHQKRRPTIRSNNNDRNKTSANKQGCSTTNPQNRLPAVLHGAHQPIRRNTSQKPTKPEPPVGPSETSQRSRSIAMRYTTTEKRQPRVVIRHPNNINKTTENRCNSRRITTTRKTTSNASRSAYLRIDRKMTNGLEPDGHRIRSPRVGVGF